jgi:hypothetical protein
MRFELSVSGSHVAAGHELGAAPLQQLAHRQHGLWGLPETLGIGTQVDRIRGGTEAHGRQPRELRQRGQDDKDESWAQDTD